MSYRREDISFAGGAHSATLRGWLYLPERDAPAPVVVLSHGFAAVKEQYLDRFAEVFAAAGLAALVYDHRNFGASDGLPRQDIDPWQQIADMRHAITYAQTRPEIDGARLGLWGTSFSGGHVQVVAALDRRVKCVVAQVPTISGGRSARRRVSPDQEQGLLAAFHHDRLQVFHGAEPATRLIVPDESGQSAQYTTPDALAFFARPGSRPASFVNAVTLRSLEAARGYEPATYIGKIAPTPLLMIVARDDTVTLTDLALEAYEHARQPKALLLLPGGHFSPYDDGFAQASTAACDWFLQYL